jgi:hypothetical protein
MVKHNIIVIMKQNEQIAIFETKHIRRHYDDKAEVSKKGGAIAKNARKALKAKTGKNVITNENFLSPTKKQSKIK